jgi:hypothetical protein
MWATRKVVFEADGWLSANETPPKSRLQVATLWYLHLINYAESNSTRAQKGTSKLLLVLEQC